MTKAIGKDHQCYCFHGARLYQSRLYYPMLIPYKLIVLPTFGQRITNIRKIKFDNGTVSGYFIRVKLTFETRLNCTRRTGRALMRGIVG